MKITFTFTDEDQIAIRRALENMGRDRLSAPSRNMTMRGLTIKAATALANAPRKLACDYPDVVLDARKETTEELQVRKLLFDLEFALDHGYKFGASLTRGTVVRSIEAAGEVAAEHASVPHVERAPEFYRSVANGSNNWSLIRACLLLAADDIDRLRGRDDRADWWRRGQ